jgi:hypothetical protein
MFAAPRRPTRGRRRSLSSKGRARDFCLDSTITKARNALARERLAEAQLASYDSSVILRLWNKQLRLASIQEREKEGDVLLCRGMGVLWGHVDSFSCRQYIGPVVPSTRCVLLPDPAQLDPWSSFRKVARIGRACRLDISNSLVAGQRQTDDGCSFDGGISLIANLHLRLLRLMADLHAIPTHH